MNGPVPESEGADRLAGGFDDGALHIERFARGGDVDGLFEEWSFEGIGLVEDGDDLELAAGHQTFESELAALDITLDLDRFIDGFVNLADFGLFEDAANATKGGDELIGTVGANDAAAGGQSERFQDAGECRAGRDFAGIGINRDAEVFGYRKSGSAEEFTHAMLVAAGGDRVGCMPGQIKVSGGQGGDLRWAIGYGHDAIDAEATQGLRCSLGVLETHGDGMILPRILEDVAAVGCKDDVDAKALGSGRKGSGLIASGRGDEQYSRHNLARRGIDRQRDAIAERLFQASDGAVLVVIVGGSTDSDSADHLAIDNDGQAAGIGEKSVVKG